MVKKFRLGASESVEPWTLLFHQVEILDAAANVAEEERDIESLLEVASHIGAASDRLIELYLFLTGEEEQQDSTDGSVEPKRLPIGFHVQQPEPEEESCNCGDDEE